MIRKLVENDRQVVLNFLNRNPGLNLFLIGDIENHGFDCPIQDVWGSFNDNKELNGVLLRYRQNYIPYFEDQQFNVQSFKDIIESDPNISAISGESKIIERFLTCFKQCELRDMYFCELRENKHLHEVKVPVKLATAEDASRIFDLLLTIEEFKSDERNSVDHVREKIVDGSGRIYYVENDKKEIVCNAQTTAENSTSAMVVSVATKKDYRGQGLMSQTLSKLCQDLLSENKTLCLFYDNPNAGRVYHKLGFETIGKWSMLFKK